MGRRFLQQHSLQIGYAALGVILFFAFLLARFPYADTLSGVLAPMGLRVSSREQGMSFPFGVKLSGVILDSVDGGHQFFQSDQLRVTPALLSFLIGSPGVKIKADAYGGNFDLWARRSGDATALSFSGADLHLERYPALKTLGLNLDGIISGDGDIYVSQQDLAADHGVIHLAASDAALRLVPGIPPLKIGTLTASINLDKGRLNLEQLASHGGDVTLSGRGVIQLEPNLADSAIAIRFQLEATPTGRERLGFLLNLLPHPPSSTPYFLHGTLGAPALS